MPNFWHLALIEGAIFGPEALKAVGQAFDEAWAKTASHFRGEQLVREGARLALANVGRNRGEPGSQVLKQAGLQVIALNYKSLQIGAPGGQLKGMMRRGEGRLRGSALRCSKGPITIDYVFEPICKSGAAERSSAMANLSDLTNVAGMTEEMRDRVVAALDALSNWRDEIEAANKRCLGKVLDQTSAVARSMGWPDEAVKTTREYLRHTAKLQTQVIDQLMERWKQQLTSPIAPMVIPRALTGQTSGPSASTLAGAMPDFDALAPWKMWLQAAEMWQRTWMPDVAKRGETRPHKSAPSRRK